MARTGGICGKQLPDGGVCHNPPGCTIRHKQRPQLVQFEAALTLATDAIGTQDRYKDYPIRVVDEVVKPLPENTSLVPPPFTGKPACAVDHDHEVVRVPDERITGISHQTISNIIRGLTWPDLHTIATLETELEERLWGTEHLSERIKRKLKNRR